MKKHTHYIQKHVLILDFSTEGKARQWHNTTTTFYYGKFLPLLNTVLDRHAPGSRYYFIDSLEIDLGIVDEEKLQETIIKKVEAELTRILKSESTHYFFKAVGTTSEDNARPGEKVFIKESKEHLIECFYYFLDHGILPWNSSFKSLVMLEAALKQEIGLEKLASYTDFQKRLHRGPTRKRLYFQFSRSFWEEVCNHLFRPALANLLSIREDLVSILMLLAKSVSAKKRLRQELSKDLQFWIGNAAPPDTKHWPLHYIRWVVRKASPNVRPVGETAILKSIMQELIIKKKEQHDTTALARALKAIIASADTSQKVKIIQQQDHNVIVSNQIKPASAEGSKSDLPETDKTTRSPGNTEKSLSAKKKDKSEIHNSDEDTVQNELTTKESKAPPPHQTENILKEAEATEPVDSQNSLLSNAEKADAEASPSVMREQAAEGKLADPDLPNEGGEVTDSQQAGPMEKKKKDQVPAEDGPSTDDFLISLLLKPENEGGKQADRFTEPDVYYLMHAGMVLTWPYLSRLFHHTDYLEKNAFKSPQHQQRAVHLMAYIASGREQCEEQELVMAKLLCAWPLQMPIVKDLVLTDSEKTEADQMLSGLIKNWTILKNTSLEGLRASFFGREGKLIKEEEQWRLIVEQKSYDMLLDHLPYTISIIKLPWMKAILKVDWA